MKKGLGNVETAKKEGDEDFIIAETTARPEHVASEEANHKSHVPMSLITCHITSPQEAGIQALVRAGKYLTRSDAIRAAIRKLLDEEWPRWCGA
jgi:hypothetical protein